MSHEYQYQVGLSLPPEAPSYITRQADDEFYKALKNGELCYVFNCRQMGKSSLRVRIMNRLTKEDFACAFLDMTVIVNNNMTLESFYYTIATILADSLDLSLHLSSWWKERQDLSLQQKLSDFFEKILEEIPENVIIFIDEIDRLLSLKFLTDDFFAFIRSCYEKRVDNPTYKRLTFALLGVATPSILIQDKRLTPFNLGKFIELNGFTEREALPLSKGLVDVAENPKSVLKAIIYWTGGQPFLTQKICQLVISQGDVIPDGREAEIIEELVSSRILKNWQSADIDNPQHLKTIEDRIILSHQSARLLGLYQQIVQKGSIPADISPEHIELQLSGLVVKRVVNGQRQLIVYNRVYERVFDEGWVLEQLNKICPYGESLANWNSSGQEESWLLRGQALREALGWAHDKTLNPIENQYLNASQRLELQELEHQRLERRRLELQKLKFKRKISLIFAVVFTLVILSLFRYYDYTYASCPIGSRISGECFRYIVSSGDEPYLFTDNINFHLEEGVKFFKQGKYKDAERLFSQAKDARPTNPVPHIYLNNTKARLQGNPLKLAAVAGIDFYKDVAQDILRGVADAQQEFNDNGGKNGRLLEIVIANDGNEATLAKKVARDLGRREDILGIIGHHSSESTQAAIPIYERYKLPVPVVSPTSSSSQLKSKVFFRAVLSTKEAAQKYAEYIKNTLGVDELVIFVDSNRTYSQSFYDDFKLKFKQLGGKIEKIEERDFINLNDPQLDIGDTLDKIYKRKKINTILLIPSVKNDSVVTAIAKINSNLALKLKREKLHLLTVMSLSEEIILRDGGDDLNGMTSLFPCLGEEYKYSQKAKTTWQKNQIYWRVVTGYDATQAFIEAIRLSKEPTRPEILKNLKDIELPKQKTSGYGLKWKKDQDGMVIGNANREYCIYQIRNNRFEKLDSNEKPEK